MIFLDTHVVVWLYAGLTKKFGAAIRQQMNRSEIVVSPIVRLELQYLYEIKRTTENADEILTDLSQRIGLRVADNDFDAVIRRALGLSWTRDPFDRIITAQASLEDTPLISSDKNILDHYAYARW